VRSTRRTVGLFRRSGSWFLLRGRIGRPRNRRRRIRPRSRRVRLRHRWWELLCRRPTRLRRPGRLWHRRRRHRLRRWAAIGLVGCPGLRRTRVDQLRHAVLRRGTPGQWRQRVDELRNSGAVLLRRWRPVLRCQRIHQLRDRRPELLAGWWTGLLDRLAVPRLGLGVLLGERGVVRRRLTWINRLRKAGVALVRRRSARWHRVRPGQLAVCGWLLERRTRHLDPPYRG
jgi:hypothetical protein